ncbi:MAG: outer membrane beta-barrel protein, partial [Verrucomicrobiota bacterium]|nr:outer membrane beta-barrel protein [Verrucomicrobiota bacterium]
SVNTGYDTNVSNSDTGGANSFFTSASLGLTYSFGTERTRGSLSWGAGATYYSNGKNDRFDFNPDTSLQLSLSHDVSERLSLNLASTIRYGIEPDFAAGVGENRRSGNYFYTSDSISAPYKWLERFSTVTTYSFAVLHYNDDSFGTLLNRFDNNLSQQFRFLFLPMTNIIAEYRFGLVTYETANANSVAHFLLGGIDQTIGPHLVGSFRAGAEFRSSDLEDSNSTSPYFDGSLNYELGEKTSVSVSARYSTEEGNVTEATSRTSFSTGVNLTYALTPRISSNASFFYQHNDNVGRKTIFYDPVAQRFFIGVPSFTEQSFDLGLDLSYAINPRISASAGFHYSDISSEFTGRPYSRARYFGGVTYSF